jgi:hypothetical protein
MLDRPPMQKQTQPPEQDISRSLKNFIRGLTQDDVADMYERYKALFQIGPAAIPQIRDLIFKSNWSNVRYPNEIRYVAGLVSLIHDLDESESERIRAELLSNGCAPALGRILDSIGSFRSDDYKRYEVRGIRIFEHKKLVTKQNVKRRLEQWLKSIPDKNLDAIERIYIIRKEDFAALGSYAPILYCINLVWDNPSARWNPISWVNNFSIENTLYHEIGHHVHRHTFGQDPEQEDAADQYADRIMAQRSDHFLFKVVRLFKRTIFLLPVVVWFAIFLRS